MFIPIQFLHRHVNQYIHNVKLDSPTRPYSSQRYREHLLACHQIPRPGKSQTHKTTAHYVVTNRDQTTARPVLIAAPPEFLTVQNVSLAIFEAAFTPPLHYLFDLYSAIFKSMVNPVKRKQI